MINLRINYLQLLHSMELQELKSLENQEKHTEGFQEPYEEHLTSKQKDKKIQTNGFFVIPEAKPLLSKHYIDLSKPKVLIKQIKIKRQCDSLSTSRFLKQPLSTEKVHIGKREELKLSQTTLWKKFIVSQQYKCLYIKFYPGKVSDLEKRYSKKLKNQLQKMTNNNQFLFATYIIDLAFLSEAGSYLIKNLQENTLESMHKQIENQAESLEFDSRFQCGNLMYAFEKYPEEGQTTSPRQYNLILQNDINTKGYGNWFYFSIRSKKAGKIKFNIVNLQKPHSIYMTGMKVCVFSYQKWKRQGIQWHRDGYNYYYFRNECLKNLENASRYSTLSFCIDQKYENDLIFIAANMPYSYSRLMTFLDNAEKLSKINSNIYLRKESLGSSISSNECPLLTLTWKRDKKRDDNKKKKIILVIARQHPCETVSSFVMEGFINSLVYLQSEESVELLKKYIFKIIPMISVDGVIYGNSRCDINGSDTNRKWTKNPNSFLYPILYAIKKLINNLSFEGYQFQYFIDLHGHSKKMGTFIFGCKTFDDIESRYFSWIMSKLNNKFVFEDCQFGISQFRKETARGYMNNLAINRKSLTLETSFYGYKTINGNKHYDLKDLHEIGATLIQAIHNEQFRNPQVINWDQIKSDIKNYLQKHHLSEDDKESSGSDSNPSEDQMNTKEKSVTFLPPTVAAKIGLVQIKVISKKNSRNEELTAKEKELLQKKSELELLQNSKRIKEEFIDDGLFQSQILNRYPKSIPLLRETKSITKIQPFKLTSKDKQNFSQSKKIGITISFKSIEKSSIKQRSSSPRLPRVSEKERKNFWSNFKKQYEYLITEKKNINFKQAEDPKRQIAKLKKMEKYE